MKVRQLPSVETTIEEAVDLRSVPLHRAVSQHPFIEPLRKALGFDFFAVAGLDLEGYHVGSGQSVDTDAPLAFLDAYYAEKFLKTDPVVAALQTSQGVIVEKEIYSLKPPPPQLVRLTESFGIANRTIVPVRRGEVIYGAVTFTRTEPFSAREIDFLSEISVTLHSVITRPIMEKFQARTMRLTTGEVNCLRYASLGYRSEDIASLSGFTVETVNNYIKVATRKLGTRNRAHAVAEAIRRGLIG